MRVPISKVLFIDHVGVIGGAERSLIDLTLELKSRGIDCHFILPSGGELFQTLKETGTVDIVPLQSWRWWGGSTWKLLLSLPIQLFLIVRLCRIIKRINPDIVHFNINRLVEPLFAVSLLRIKSVMHYRDIPSRIEKKFLFGLRNFFRIMNLATVWIANSKATYDDVLPSANVPVFHIPNGIDVGSFQQRAAHDLPIKLQGSFNVLMVASLTPWKNVEAFIKLAAQTSQSLPDVHFYIAGSGLAKYQNELLQKVVSLHLTERVTFLGKVEFIPALLSCVDVLIHTTINEPFGRVFVEAMLSSKPVITFSGGGADEIIEHEKTGYLVAPHDIEAMAKKLTDVLENRELRDRLGKAGFKRAVEKFSLDTHVSRVIEVYNSLKLKRDGEVNR